MGWDGVGWGGTGWDGVGRWTSPSVGGAWVQLLVALGGWGRAVPGARLVQKNPLPWNIPGKYSLLLRVCGQSHASEPLGTSSAPSFQRPWDTCHLLHTGPHNTLFLVYVDVGPGL